LPESSGDKSGVFLCGHHSTMVLHAHTSPGGRTIGLLVATVQRHKSHTTVLALSSAK
jgi:hypothetical protein